VLCSCPLGKSHGRDLPRTFCSVSQSAPGHTIACRSGVIAASLAVQGNGAAPGSRATKIDGSKLYISLRPVLPRSSLSNPTRRARVEVGLIDREGMSGIAVVLGGNQSPHATYVQVAGEGQRITAKELRNAMSASGTLHALLLKYVQVFMVQTAHTAIANARAHIDQRLARWILMAHDRTGENTLPLTHEFLALMLGVRRAGVTEALQSLKRQKLIHNGRNEITLLNRKLIERMAGNSYGVAEKEYRRLIG
jgi:Crp-like helix-turn-helix domain